VKFSSFALKSYKTAITRMPFGKRVGTHLYIHKDSIEKVPQELSGLITLASDLASESNFQFCVVKLGTRTPSVSLLDYPQFNREAFPVLSKSAKFDLEQHRLKIIDFSKSDNPPILHRKELLLPSDHINFDKFSSLTQKAEALGLFENPNKIGLRKGWQAALKSKGVKIVGHKFVVSKNVKEQSLSSDIEIHRHRTAISRQHLSAPFQILDKFGYLNGDYSIFDYGCGRGEDLKLLGDMGIDAEGWDPHYFPHHALNKADLVNLGFVINVIEDLQERNHALQNSFALANNFLVVSAMRETPRRTADLKTHGDGTLSRINTFQKYFTPDELQNYVRGTLGVPVIPVSQETVIAFRSDEELNRFFAKRAGQRRSQLRGSRRRAEELYVLDASARGVLGAFWEKCVELGREPVSEELSEYENVEQLGLSCKKAFEFLSEKFGTDDLANSAELRRQDLIVEFALGFFEKRNFYKYLTPDVKQDIASFFKNYSTLRSQAQELLFSIADETKLLTACERVASDGLGYLFDKHSLQLHVDLLDRLPPILRVYEGCAERLLGGRGSAELVKIHIQSGKVSYLWYDDFEGKPVPLLLERIKVNLWHRRIDFFDYVGPFTPQPLLMKSLFLDEESNLMRKQEPFDREMLKQGLFDFNDPHPRLEDFSSSLKAKGLKIEGFRLIGHKI
jgi:DNA phosphorothioation-associated putative methyltransferase